MIAALFALLLAFFAHAPHAPHYAPPRPTTVQTVPAAAAGTRGQPLSTGGDPGPAAAPVQSPAPEGWTPATDSPMCFPDWQGLMPADQLCWDPETGEVRLPGAK